MTETAPLTEAEVAAIARRVNSEPRFVYMSDLDHIRRLLATLDAVRRERDEAWTRECKAEERVAAARHMERLAVTTRNQQEERAEAAEREVVKLREALRKYGRHVHPACGRRPVHTLLSQHACRCGLDAALSRPPATPQESTDADA